MTKAEYGNELSKRLKHARQLKKLTQKELAKTVQMPVTQISHYETGRRIPSLYNLLRIRNALGVNLDWLIGEL